jgi:hypothetical protein
MGTRLRWSQQRLLPTTFVAILTLSHFFYLTIFSLSPSSYPLLSYVPALLESSLLFITFLTIILNILTQIVTRGRVEWRGARGVLGEGMRVRMDEDFAVAVLRVGTGCLEASAVAGLGNEVGGVVAPPLWLSFVALLDPSTTLPSDVRGKEEGALEVTRRGIGQVPTDRVYGKKKGLARGFHNEISRVKPAGYDGAVWDTAWYEAFVKFCVIGWRVIRGWTLLLWAFVRGQRATSRSHAVEVEETPDPDDTQDDSEEQYTRFLNGEEVSDDDEGEDYKPAGHLGSDSEVESSAYNTEDDEDEAGQTNEAIGLYADHLRASSSEHSAGTSTTSTAPVLLAHMTSNNSPLTRRGYAGLLNRKRSHQPDSRHEPLDSFEQYILDRRASAKLAREASELADDDETRRNCVICTVEPRDIICWPCRCLAICDGCRENLASRASTSKHTCPCCRRPVEGYSRIYIP